MICDYCNKEFPPSDKQIQRKRGYCSKECLWERRLVNGLIRKIEGRYNRKIEKITIHYIDGSINKEINRINKKKWKRKI